MLRGRAVMNHRKDDLIGIRKARFASFVLLFVCFAAMLVSFVVCTEKEQVYIAAVAIIVVLVFLWWFLYRRVMFSEAEFFEALAKDMRSVHRRLRILESAVRQTFDGVVIVSEGGDLVLVNETAKRLLAAYDGDLDGARYDEWASGFSEKLTRKAILDAAHENRQHETISVQGQVYKIGYVALVPEKGLGNGAVAVISDVTESAKVERMQIDFVANVSHELKTPLSTVRLYAETLLNGSAENPETMYEFLEVIVSEAERMGRLITSLKHLDKSESIETDPEADESDLPSLIKESMKKLDMAASSKSLSVNQMFDNDMRVNVEMNRDRIEQVIQNVLENAIKYTEEKGRVDVDIIPGQNCVQIVISDNGVGIPEEDQARVFERFYRVDKARTGKIGGTGLGLAISKQIIDAHGGTIRLERNAKRGTKVTITLPTSTARGVPGIL